MKLKKQTITMEKLRKEFLKEREMMKEVMKTVVIDRPKKTPPPPPPPSIVAKMTIDPEKLEMSIKKACVPIPKREITVLDKPPAVAVTTAPAPTGAVVAKPVAALCKALNLNGTPCKFRAKKGHFCAKHSH